MWFSVIKVTDLCPEPVGLGDDDGTGTDGEPVPRVAFAIIDEDEYASVGAKSGIYRHEPTVDMVKECIEGMHAMPCRRRDLPAPSGG
jgi:hypothetical protein